MTAAPDDNDEPEQIELPRPKRTLLGRLAHWVEHAQALKGWVQEARGDSPALDATFETIERDSHIGGGMLAGALSYRLFIFALPLAFFLVSGLGLLASALGVQANVVVNSVGVAGTVTKQVQGAAEGSSSWWVALTALLVLAYMTRVLLRSVAIVHALAWEGSAASVKVQLPPARDLRRSNRVPAPARRRRRRRRPPDRYRRRHRTGGLRARPRPGSGSSSPSTCPTPTHAGPT